MKQISTYSLVFLLIQMIAGIVLTNFAAPAAAREAACAELRGISRPNATLTATELVPAGPYTTRRGGSETTVELPAHCRVAMLLTPSVDSSIEMAGSRCRYPRARHPRGVA